MWSLCQCQNVLKEKKPINPRFGCLKGEKLNVYGPPQELADIRNCIPQDVMNFATERLQKLLFGGTFMRNFWKPPCSKSLVNVQLTVLLTLNSSISILPLPGLHLLKTLTAPPHWDGTRFCSDPPPAPIAFPTLGSCLVRFNACKCLSLDHTASQSSGWNRAYCKQQ